MSKGGAYRKLGKQGIVEFRRGVNIYGPKTDLTKAAYSACELGRLPQGHTQVLDAMSGPGKFGSTILVSFLEERDEGKHHGKALDVTFNDIREEPLMMLRAEGYRTAHCDVREIGQKHAKTFHVAMARFGIKDIPEQDKHEVLWSLNRSLIAGGRLVIVDMCAPSVETQAAVNEVHSTKQTLAGREQDKEGVCHIPTEEQWVQLLKGTNFMPVTVTFRGKSDVDTQQWRGQFGPDADDDHKIKLMNETIARTSVRCPEFERDFSVKLGDGLEKVTLSFPVLVITGDKL
jgi:ubiquinone/menaquinone biosynthesis C-methylase UbiE